MAQFDPTKKEYTADNNKIIYDYFNIPINKSEITPSTSTASPITAEFVNSTVNPNLYYTADGKTQSYNAKKMFFYKGALHDIRGLTDTKNTNFIGELVIEHKDSANNKSMYTCYLLEKPSPYGANPPIDIDRIIALRTATDKITENVVLNKSIPSQDSCIVYQDTSDKAFRVFVFTTPITVSKETAEVINALTSKSKPIFSTAAPTKYDIIPAANISLKQEEQIYMDCNPTGEGVDPESEEAYNYSVPIKSAMMGQLQEMNFMKTVVNFCIFVVGLIFCFYIVPIFYKYLFIDKTFLLTQFTNTTKFLTRVRSLDVSVSILFLILIITLFSNGYGDKNYYMITGGFFSIIFYILSFSLIWINKSDAKFMRVDVPGGPPQDFTYPDNFKAGIIELLGAQGDIWDVLASVKNLFLENNFGLLVGALVAEVFYVLLIMLLYVFGQFGAKIRDYALSAGMPFIFLFSILFAIIRKNGSNA